MKKVIRIKATILLLAAFIAAAAAPVALARDFRELDRDAATALKQLTRQNSTAKLLNGKARAVLVFPSILKAGFMFGGQMGDGTLMKNGRPVAHYNSLAGSYGLQAGVQRFGYALFFMNDSALSYLDRSGGWEVGVGPSIVVVDQGMGRSITSTTISHDVYAFIFNQKGLMGGLGVQGSKITKLD